MDKLELIRSMLVVTPPDTRTGRHLKTIYRGGFALLHYGQ